MKTQLLAGVYFCKGFAQTKCTAVAMQVTTCFVDVDGKISHLNGVPVSDFSNHVVWNLQIKKPATIWPDLLPDANGDY